jgi:hypothetical protein
MPPTSGLLPCLSITLGRTKTSRYVGRAADGSGRVYLVGRAVLSFRRWLKEARISASGGRLTETQYHACMTEQNTALRIRSWAMPTDADLAEWQAMTRDEQLAAFQALAHHPKTMTPSNRTVDEILADVRSKRRPKRLQHGPGI